MNTRRTIKSHKELIVWRKSMDLVEEVYKVTNRYPRSELFVLTSQTRKSAISIPSNESWRDPRGFSPGMKPRKF